jgi:hypothetical protein
MIARSSWSAKPDQRSDQKKQARSGADPDVPLDDLLEARFDDAGNLAQAGQGNRRLDDTLDARPPDLGADELERAVQKLAQGLEYIERESRPSAQAAGEDAAPRDQARERDFVTYSLDRLEARLEALSQRLQQRAAGVPQSDTLRGSVDPRQEEPTAAPATAAAEPRRFAGRQADPSLAIDASAIREAERAELRRLADIERARLEAE